MQKFLKAAQARKLDRVAAVYAIAGWILVQGASILLPTFDAPVWALRVFIAGVFVGFPIALAIAWTAIPHPHPHRRDTQVLTTQTDKTVIALLGVVILLSLGQFAYEFWYQPTASPSRSVASPAPQPGPAEASIAVLPFVNMSGDPNKEYFSDGVSEELLNDLSNDPALNVAARTSSFSFKGKNETIQEIARALNVRTVLEGSVREDGQHIRITAQLINAANGYHLWSATYDRDLIDILKLQDEIAQVITHELTGRLFPNKSSGATPPKPKINPEAYTAYLQGRFFLNKRNTDDMRRAVDFFKQAISLEPNYADAHASLGRTYSLLYSNGQNRNTFQAAKNETAAALKIDPDNFLALVTKGIIAFDSWNWQEAETTYRRALARNPNDADAQHFYAGFLYWLNLPEAALTPGRRAAALDPLAPVMWHNIGNYLVFLNRKAEAVAEYQAALTLDPNFVVSLGSLCQIYVDMGKIDEARKILRDRLIPVDGEDGPFAGSCRVFIAWQSGDLAELKRLVTIAKQYYARGELPASDVGFACALTGDMAQAIYWFEKAYDDRDIGLLIDIHEPVLPAKLKSDPRWKALMQRPLMKDWQAAHDRVAAELAAEKQTQ